MDVKDSKYNDEQTGKGVCIAHVEGTREFVVNMATNHIHDIGINYWNMYLIANWTHSVFC